MLAINGVDRAARIADMVPVVARQHADNEHPYYWAEQDSRERFIAMLRSMEAWTEGPEWDRIVVVRPRLAPTGDYWTHTASEILDKAIDVVDREAGDDYSFRHAEISVDGTHGASVTWRHKPNLDRLYERGWTHNPMITFVFEGRRFFLQGNEHTPVYVANRYPFRHGDGARSYAYQVTLLSRYMNITIETARRLSEALVPDRCGLNYERNPMIRILSQTEEWAVHARRVDEVDCRLACGECGAHAGEDCRRGGCPERTVLR